MSAVDKAPELLPCAFYGGPAAFRGAAIRCTSFTCNASMSPVWTTAEIRKAKGDHAEKLRIAIEQTAERWNRREAVDMGECAAFFAGYEAADRWNRRADLAAPSAPADVKGLVAALRSYQQADMDGVIVKVSRQACDEAATTLTALQAEITRLTAERDEAESALWRIMPNTHTIGGNADPFEGPGETYEAACRRLTAELEESRAGEEGALMIIASERADVLALRRQLAEARASAAAAYEMAARVAEGWGNCARDDDMAREIRALATEAETTALAEMLDAETRACAQICDRNDQVGGWVSRDAILARIDQRKEAGHDHP